MIDEIVEFWDEFGSEKGAVWQCGFLDNTRFGPDVILCTLSCHEDRLVNLLIVKKSHGKPSRHGSSGPLEVHLLPCPDLLEWVNKTSLFTKQFHVYLIVRFLTLQRSLDRLSVLYLVVLVPLIQILDNLCMTLNVIWRQMVGVGSCHPQVLPTVDGSVIVRPATKQACFLCHRACVSVVRERTGQDQWKFHF